MTTQQFDKRFTDLLDESRNRLWTIALRLRDSGGVDLAVYGDDYELPRAVLCAALNALGDGYAPLTREGKRVVKNLAHF